MRPLPDYTDAAQAADASLYKTYIDFYFSLFDQVGGAFGVQESSPTAMTVYVGAGAIQDSSGHSAIAAQTTGTITAPVTDPRIDRVVLDMATGAVSVVAGSEAPSPSAPAVPAGKMALAQIALATDTTAITEDLITDERAVLVSNVLDEDDFASDSAAFPPSQQSAKAYMDAINSALQSAIDAISPSYTYPVAWGTDYTLSATAQFGMCALSDKRLAVANNDTNNLYTMEVTDANALAVNTSATGSVTMSGDVSVCRLSATRIAMVSSDGLRTFDENDGAGGWSQTGNTLAITGFTSSSGNAITALDSTTVVVADDNANTLTVYGFDGTDWSAVGSALTVAGMGGACVAALSDASIAYHNQAVGTLRAYAWTGSAFVSFAALTGASTNIPPAMVALSDDTVCLMQASDEPALFQISGSTWVELIGTRYSGLTGSGSNATMAAMSSTTIAYLDTANNLKRIKWHQEILGGVPGLGV